MAHFDYVEDAALFIADLGLTFSDGNTEFSIEKEARPSGFLCSGQMASRRRMRSIR